MMIQTTVGVPMDAMVLNNYFRTLINLFFNRLNPVIRNIHSHARKFIGYLYEKSSGGVAWL